MSESSNIPPAFVSEVVYSLPYAGETVLDQSYGGTNQLFDVYYPEAGTKPFPVVLIVLGFPAPGFAGGFGFKLKDSVFYRSWAMLLAASGMAAVLYSADDAEPNTLSLLGYLQEHNESLNLDMSKLGIWSCSANVPNAINVINKTDGIVCASLNYGFMLDLDGSTVITDTAEQIKFADPNGGEESMLELDQLITKAGQDAFPGINDSIDAYMSLAKARNLPVELIEYEAGVHSFDVLDDSAESIAVVKRMVDFLKSKLID
jgi:hypothetical protein